jgi:hypothetical protein
MNKFDTTYNKIFSNINVSTSLNYRDNLNGVYKLVKETKRYVKKRRR